MGTLLAEWGLEILFGLISMGIFGYAKMTVAKIKKELEESKKEAAEKEKQALEATIDIHLEPVYEELEELRRYIRDTENIEKSHMTLIIASYRFRLIQLCKAFLKQGFITPEQMEQLSEFYKLYTGLGGNGQAKIYYDKAMALPMKINVDEAV